MPRRAGSTQAGSGPVAAGFPRRLPLLAGLACLVAGPAAAEERFAPWTSTGLNGAFTTTYLGPAGDQVVLGVWCEPAAGGRTPASVSVVVPFNRSSAFGGLHGFSRVDMRLVTERNGRRTHVVSSRDHFSFSTDASDPSTRRADLTVEALAGEDAHDLAARTLLRALAGATGVSVRLRVDGGPSRTFRFTAAGSARALAGSLCMAPRPSAAPGARAR